MSDLLLFKELCMLFVSLVNFVLNKLGHIWKNADLGRAMKQYEAIIEAMKQHGGYATLGQLYQTAPNIPGSEWKQKRHLLVFATSDFVVIETRRNIRELKPEKLSRG